MAIVPRTKEMTSSSAMMPPATANHWPARRRETRGRRETIVGSLKRGSAGAGGQEQGGHVVGVRSAVELLDALQEGVQQLVDVAVGASQRRHRLGQSLQAQAVVALA